MRNTDKKTAFAFYWKLFNQPHNYLEEYNFDPPRKHRFDFAWPKKLIAVEVDGNAWHVAGGGRHGSDTDREKLNIAAFMGWRVFHFSPQMLKQDPISCIEMVAKTIQEHSVPPQDATQVKSRPLVD